ncbi:methyltransferase domain-containing protein [Rhizobiaceae bacterium BDR2-2]|uniref:Methyltransferase domain-containing protein n=1 Tax=Ectorhizobium quercum TaxID=2965071 RepID=A0AAE3MX95_9HYPH|nr:methyltransferase domain-containing protein [Ectorhizobium quercum]MCX8995997.1 methyltransferase domain-containing protein [Ectorhizobium quercum]
MVPASLSSGDLLADRRAAYAKLLSGDGLFAEAAELMEQALELAPGWRAGWFQLGEYREKAGNRDGAVEAYARVAQGGGEDIFGANLKLAVLGAADMPARPESAYAESLFDDYADRFEEALTGKLGYDLPALLAERIAAHGGGRQHFSLVADIGCGTGLAGPEVRPLAERLEGFDISANMLARAREKGVYDHLGRADLSLSVEESGLFAAGLPRRRADLVLAADVMIYLGDLDAVFALAAELVKPNGFFAFSVETAEEGYVLQPSLRYAHSEAHVGGLFARHGFERRLFERVTLRMDRGKPVFGFVFIAERTG